MINKLPYLLRVDKPFAANNTHFDRNSWWEVSITDHYVHLRPVNKVNVVPTSLARTHIAELAQNGTLTAFKLGSGTGFASAVIADLTGRSEPDYPIEGRNEPPGG